MNSAHSESLTWTVTSTIILSITLVWSARLILESPSFFIMSLLLPMLHALPIAHNYGILSLHFNLLNIGLLHLSVMHKLDCNVGFSQWWLRQYGFFRNSSWGSRICWIQIKLKHQLDFVGLDAKKHPIVIQNIATLSKIWKQSHVLSKVLLDLIPWSRHNVDCLLT